MRSLVWRRLDRPGMEIARVESFVRAEGTQIGIAYELRWRLDADRLELEIVGGDSCTIELGDADFFDVFASPFFNSLPVMRDGLLELGPPHAYEMEFVDVPSLRTRRSLQRYTPKGDRVVGYASGDFAADIEFDADGLVVRYDGFLERVD
jgi:uncharacterized protein